MKKTGIAALCIVLAAFSLTACSPPFSRELLDRVDRNVTFAELQKEPERYRGKMFMLGGIIVEARNLKEGGTQLEVLQQPLDGEGRPAETDETGGRFLVVAQQFLDTAIFHRGRVVTFIAEGAGQEVRPLGQIEYRYPLLTAKAIHLWAPYSGPRFSVGIGVYRGF